MNVAPLPSTMSATRATRTSETVESPGPDQDDAGDRNSVGNAGAFAPPRKDKSVSMDTKA
jgi:hypothetical protein